MKYDVICFTSDEIVVIQSVNLDHYNTTQLKGQVYMLKSQKLRLLG